MSTKTAIIESNQENLKKQTAAYIAGELSQNDLKHDTAPFGIYPQRDDRFMTRIRVNGGMLPVDKFTAIADIIEATGADFAHITTRQDIQLHGLDPDKICLVTELCAEAGLPFQGGGGNTVRNIIVSERSGVNPEDCFDVQPYANALWDFMFEYEKGYQLPRKLKIGFAAGEYDSQMVQLQDLGFIATEKNGTRGFQVYGGGGMGRESASAVKLIDFIPVEQVIQCTVAMTDLFYDHGNRENRNQARIRFIVKKIGAEAFVRLFNEYFTKAVDSSPLCFPDAGEDYHAKVYSGNPEALPGFELWKKAAVSPTSVSDNIVSVRFFVPRGNLNPAQINTLASIAECGAAPYFRLSRSQDLILPEVQVEVLPEIYRILRQDLAEIDLTGESFTGHLVACIGSNTCKIGILDSPGMADAAAVELDKYFADKPEVKAELLTEIIDSVRFSGCPNSCGAHPAARLGIQGGKKKFADSPEPAGTVFTRKPNELLGKANGEALPVADLPELVKNLIVEMYI